jgi:Terpene synthase family 2, C-terminal metal binding
VRANGTWIGHEAKTAVNGHDEPSTLTVFCPFTPKISPTAGEVQRHALHWATRQGLLEGPLARAAFASAKFANLMARAHPEASLADLGLATAWLTAIFEFDDRLERQLVEQPVRTRRAVDELWAWLSGGDNLSGDNLSEQTREALSEQTREALGRPFCRALADVWRRTVPRVTAGWRERFVNHFADYLGGIVWESANRASGKLPTVAEYLRMRRHSAATEMFFDLIEPMHGIELPGALLRDARYLAVRETGGTAIGLFNDLISWRKEAVVGDLHNIIFIVQHERRSSLADAVGYAVAEHDAQVAAFLAARDELAAGAWGADPAVALGVADIAHWIRGNLDWSLESGRYAPVGASIPVQRPPGTA